jgi:predicted DNA-binding ribbon-helix-helix protein
MDNSGPAIRTPKTMCSLFTTADPDLWQMQTRSLRLGGMSTSVRLEAFFWTVLEEIGARDGLTVSQLLVRLQDELTAADRAIDNFASFLRVCCGRYLALRAEGAIAGEGSLRAYASSAFEPRRQARPALRHAAR